MANNIETAVRPVMAAKSLRMLGPLMLAMLSACILPDPGAFNASDQSVMVAITSEQLTLQWDVPLGVVDHYTVYYRVHGSSPWIELADVPADPRTGMYRRAFHRG